MKFALFLIVSFLCVYSVKLDVVTTWGNVNTREVGSERAIVPSTILQVKTYKFTFPKVPLNAPITGIRHTDHKSHPVKVQFVQGNIGFNSITILLTSQRGHGINSTFTFYA